MSLANLQSMFQNGLLTGSRDILARVCDGAQTSKAVMFGVYQDAYVLRLLGILQDDFKRLHTYTGDAAFEALARDFITSHPSHTPNARYFSQGFAEFVALDPRFCGCPMVGAIAELEDALGSVFDCEDVAALTLGDLSAFAPEHFARLTFTPHPSVRRIDAPAGLEAIFTALSADEIPPPTRAGSEREPLIIWRKDVVPHYRTLSTEETMMWDEAAKGVPFGMLCEMAATYDEPETAAMRAAQYLQSWIAGGLLRSAALQA